MIHMKIFFLVIVLFVSIKSNAQDISYNRKMVDTLASASFWGRGYTKDGMQKAAIFLAKEFKTLGLQPLDKNDYFQKFTYSANTFPGEMKVTVNNKKLIPGVDFLVTADSHSSDNKSKLVQKDMIVHAYVSDSHHRAGR